MNILQKGLHILSWFVMALIIGVLWLIGLVVIPFMLLWSSDEDNMDIPRWFPWGNAEEGCPEWWWSSQYLEWYEGVFPRWWWFAMRNIVNNHRYWFKERKASTEGNWVADAMEAQDMIDVGVLWGAVYRWRWSGPFAGYRRVKLEGNGKYSEWWFGWKVGSIVKGMGFTMQRRKNREIGT